MRRDGGDRIAVVHHPATARAGAPLVVVLHGAGGAGADMQANLGWDALADREGLVVAYPDGLDHTWNAGACCGRARDRRVDDVGFLDALVAAVRGADGIGPVYAVGFSNGAMMTYAWACARPGRARRDRAGRGRAGGRLPRAGAADRRRRARDARRARADRRRPRAVRGRVPVARRLTGAVPGRRGMPDGDARPWPRRPASTRGPARATRVVSDVVDGLPHVWPGAGPDAGTTDGPLDATGFLWARLHG